MKNTFKSKKLWSTIGALLIFQLIALEPFLPKINEYLPAEYAFIGTLVIPSIVVFAKVIRDKGFLTNYLNSKGYVLSTPEETEPSNVANEIIKDTVKKATKKATKK